MFADTVPHASGWLCISIVSSSTKDNHAEKNQPRWITFPTLHLLMYSHSPGLVLTPENDSSSDKDTGHLVRSDTEHAGNEQSPEENDNDTLGNTEEAILPRRSTRQRQPPDRYGDYVSY